MLVEQMLHRLYRSVAEHVACLQHAARRSLTIPLPRPKTPGHVGQQQLLPSKLQRQALIQVVIQERRPTVLCLACWMSL